MCIGICKVYFGIPNNGKISSIYDRAIHPPHDGDRVLVFHLFFICKGDSFCDFLFAFSGYYSHLEKGSTLEGKYLLPKREQLISF